MITYRWLALVLVVIMLAVACGGGGDNPTSTPVSGDAVSATATASAVPSVEPSPTSTPAPTPTITPQPSPTPTPDPAVYRDVIFTGLAVDRERTSGIYSVDTDGSDLQPLVDDYGAYTEWPFFSPDGSRAAINRYDGGLDVIDIATGETRRIVEGRAIVAWSPDGTRLALQWQEHSQGSLCCGGTRLFEDPPRIAVANADGSDLRVLTESTYQESSGGTIDSAPVWSPDGSQVLFSRMLADPDYPYSGSAQQTIAIASADGSSVREVDTGEVDPGGWFTWLPNGNAFVFVGMSLDDPADRDGLYAVTPDGGGATRLSPPGVTVSLFAQVGLSSSSETIVFAGCTAPDGVLLNNCILYEAATDGSEIRELAGPYEGIAGLAFSPDGSRIAFSAYDHTLDTNSLYVIDADGSGLTPFNTGHLYWEPGWSPDGKRLVYLYMGETPQTDIEVRILDVTTGEITPSLARILLAEGAIAPIWRPAATAPPAPDHGWSDDTLQALIPAAANPRLSGNWIVWAQDETPENVEDKTIGLYALHRETGEQVAIAAGPDVGWQFNAAHGLVVWTDVSGLHGRRLGSGEKFEVTSYPSWTPALSDCRVVWTTLNPDDTMTLLTYDFCTDSGPVTLAESDAHTFIMSYAVSGDRAVWVEQRNPPLTPSTLLVVRDLISGNDVMTSEQPAAIHPVDLEDSTLVYVVPARDWFSGEPATVVAFDLDTGETRSFPAYINTHEGGYPIETDGRFIIWEGYPSGYDLELDTYFDVPVNGFGVDLEDGLLSWGMRRDAMVGPTEVHVAPAEEFSSGQRSRYFPETGHWLSTGFLSFWDANGGLPVFGYPLAPRSPWGDEGVRYLERQRFEWQPDHAGTVYEIELGRLGAELLEQQGRDWEDFPVADPNSLHYFPVTRHAIAPEFWDYWSTQGLNFGDRGVTFRESLALFGYPLSEPMMETNADGDTVLTQYFERAVFEYHPDNPSEYQVLLRRLGAELIGSWSW